MFQNKMINQEPNQEPNQESLTQKVTSIENKTKPKDPGRVAVGKRLAELTKKDVK